MRSILPTQLDFHPSRLRLITFEELSIIIIQIYLEVVIAL